MLDDILAEFDSPYQRREESNSDMAINTQNSNRALDKNELIGLKREHISNVNLEVSEEKKKKEEDEIDITGSLGDNTIISEFAENNIPVMQRSFIEKVVTETGKNVKQTRETLDRFIPEEKMKLHDEFMFFLQEKFDKAYKLAIEQMKQGRLKPNSNQQTSNLIINYRKEKEIIFQTELDSRRQELEIQLKEEQQKQRFNAYRRKVEILSAQQREKKIEYQSLLERYYTQNEEGRFSLDSILSTKVDSLDEEMRLTNIEELAIQTTPESINKDQIRLLKRVLKRLEEEINLTKENVQRVSSENEIAISTAAARIQQQYLSIISEQQHELKMLQRWYNEIQQLEKETKESIKIYAEQRRQRQEHLQNHQLSQKDSNFKINSSQDDFINSPERKSNHKSGLFDFLL